jgi:NAD(P)-dependent dehydrogenase (short-subunit alcohol dehydrogenase family)
MRVPRRALLHPDGRITPLTLDVTIAAQVRETVEKVDSLDLLINNAGVARKDDLSDRAALEWHLAVQLFGTNGMTQAFLPLLARSRGSNRGRYVDGLDASRRTFATCPWQMTSNAGASQYQGSFPVRSGDGRLNLARPSRSDQPPPPVCSCWTDGAGARIASRNASPMRVRALPADSASPCLTPSSV